MFSLKSQVRLRGTHQSCIVYPKTPTPSGSHGICRKPEPWNTSKHKWILNLKWALANFLQLTARESCGKGLCGLCKEPKLSSGLRRSRRWTPTQPSGRAFAPVWEAVFPQRNTALHCWVPPVLLFASWTCMLTETAPSAGQEGKDGVIFGCDTTCDHFTSRAKLLLSKTMLAFVLFFSPKKN